uniref:Retrotransposon, putative, centromere-specific, expressed n=1 Tax=Oryza sativa subsp. japonica TaxID=39947 RepID=Q10I96_ORYSJ|nr:retrotransposon, putative, centromere-specific, expressed [Oryza sativa Japonica Group]
MAGLHKGKRDGHAQPRLLHHQRDIATSSRIAYEGAQNIHHEEKSDMLEMSSPSLTKEEEKTDAPTLSEEGIKGKLNGADITQGECASDESHLSTIHANLEQILVETTFDLPLSQVDLLAIPCDKEELCNNASLISLPQLVNEHAISSVSLCADFKHDVHIANDVEERKLITSLNTFSYVQFDDFCELNNLEEKLVA